MFRFRLAIVIIISFGFVLFLGIAMYWGSIQVDRNFQRSQAAYEAFNLYERVSQEAYRHFKQRMDWLITNRPTAKTGVESSKHRLYEAMQALRNNAVKTTQAESLTIDKQDKATELKKVAHFTAFLDASEYRFEEVEQLRRQGKYQRAVQALSKFSEEEIDGKFQPLIDASIKAEREKARIAKQKLENLVTESRWIAIIASSVAALFSFMSGVLLLRGVRKPIEALMKGTNEIASGNLNYRIALNTGNEFSYLASHFNQMAQELELQQDKLREGRAVLEQRVAERTSELHQLNDELIHMNDARRELLADISHELRTPITVILGEAEVTLRGPELSTWEYKDTLQRIVELAMQLGKYINDLLFIARTENANLQFEWDTFDIAELVISTVDDFQVMAEENSITVSLNALPEPLWVRGDKQRLRQALFILGDNACRYSHPGGHITTALWTDGKSASISLKDQGIGIPIQDLERIFDRHFRSQNAQLLRNDGTGLGLSMAKSILKAHGGSITVTSTENSGSTFTISLPLFSVAQNGNNNNET